MGTLTEWPDALIEDYLNILDSMLIVSGRLDLALDTTITRVVFDDSPYTVSAASEVVAANEVFVCDTDGGAIAFNLPEGTDGRNLRIANTGKSSNLVTVTPDGTELMTGANASRTLGDKSVIRLVFETTEGWW